MDNEPIGYHPKETKKLYLHNVFEMDIGNIFILPTYLTTYLTVLILTVGT